MLTRRDVLKLMGLTTAAVVIGGCVPQSMLGLYATDTLVPESPKASRTLSPSETATTQPTATEKPPTATIEAPTATQTREATATTDAAEITKTLGYMKKFMNGEIKAGGDNPDHLVDSNGKPLEISHFGDLGVKDADGIYWTEFNESDGTRRYIISGVQSIYLGHYTNIAGMDFLIWGQTNPNGERIVWASSKGFDNNPDYATFSHCQFSTGKTNPLIFGEGDVVNQVIPTNELPTYLAAFQGLLVEQDVVIYGEDVPKGSVHCGKLNSKECSLAYKTMGQQEGGVLHQWLSGEKVDMESLSFVLPGDSQDLTKLDGVDIPLIIQSITVPKWQK